MLSCSRRHKVKCARPFKPFSDFPQNRHILLCVAFLVLFAHWVSALEASTGRLLEPAQFSLISNGKSVGVATMPAGTPVRVLAQNKTQLRVQSSIGTAWVDHYKVNITGEELAFEKQEIIEALRKSQRMPGPRHCTRKVRRYPIPDVPELPTGHENVPSSSQKIEKEVFDLVNRERRQRGLPALRWDSDLARAARFHAAHMARYRYFHHDTHLPGKGKVLECFQRIGLFSKKAGGENIAWNQPTSRDVMQSWMNSPGHRANILRRNARTLGVGYIAGYWVQNFGQ